MVGFRNDKRLKREQIMSEREFPLLNVFYDKNHTYTILDLSDRNMFFKYTKALADFIIKKYEAKILKRIINKNYPQIPKITVNEIIKLKDDESISERKMVIEKTLNGYFSENKSANVEGIVNFRLNEYKKQLKILAENLVDIYYLNREYDDFIELLRYFISVQDLRPEIIYIRVNEMAMYTVLDEKKHDITRQTLIEIISPNDAEKVAYDDLLISMLISLAPKKIVVVNRENIKNPQLFETIEKVFGNVEYKNSL